jgi:hypothetical protein
MSDSVARVEFVARNDAALFAAELAEEMAVMRAHSTGSAVARRAAANPAAVLALQTTTTTSA